MACLSRQYHFKYFKTVFHKFHLVNSWIICPICEFEHPTYFWLIAKISPRYLLRFARKAYYFPAVEVNSWNFDFLKTISIFPFFLTLLVNTVCYFCSSYPSRYYDTIKLLQATIWRYQLNPFSTSPKKNTIWLCNKLPFSFRFKNVVDWWSV